VRSDGVSACFRVCLGVLDFLFVSVSDRCDYVLAIAVCGVFVKSTNVRALTACVPLQAFAFT
jgi:hypothetical protein